MELLDSCGRSEEEEERGGRAAARRKARGELFATTETPSQFSNLFESFHQTEAMSESDGTRQRFKAVNQLQQVKLQQLLFP